MSLIEIGVNDTFFPVPAAFSFNFSPDEFSGLAGQVGFFEMAYRILCNGTFQKSQEARSRLSLASSRCTSLMK